MKRFTLLTLLLAISFNAVWALGTKSRCDYYRVKAKEIVLYEDSALTKERARVHEGDILEVDRHNGKNENGDVTWSASQYVPEKERSSFNEPDCKIANYGYVEIGGHGLLKGGQFIYSKGLLEPIDPPDEEALEKHKINKIDRIWSWFYDPLAAGVFLLSCFLLILSILRLKIIRAVVVGVLSLFCVFWFYGGHADTYLGTFIISAGIFMPLAFGNLFLPWENSAKKKQTVLDIIALVAIIFSFIVTFVFLNIKWDGWFWKTIVSALIALLNGGAVFRAGELTLGEVCPECGYYGRQKETDSQVLSEKHGKEYQTTEYRRTSDNSLHHTELQERSVTVTTSQIWKECGHCGHEYTYTSTETSRGVFRRI